MEKGFLLLVGNYYDLVHYIKIEDVYYTLSRDNVEKIFDINNKVDFYIKKVTLAELEATRKDDPYYLNHPQLSATDRQALIADQEYQQVDIIINTNQQAISDFQTLSVAEDFAYFKDLSQEDVVLLEYKEL